MNTEAVEADVLLARDGDEAAFHRLVAFSGNTVSSIALAITRSVEASEDVAQESFLAAWANLRKLRNPASFLPWLRQLTRNQAHLATRSRGREVNDADAVASVLDDRPSPADRMLEEEEQRLLQQVLDEIPDETREVLVLYYREGASARDLALLLGISEQAVRQRLSRARALVREEMLQRFGRTVSRTAPGAAFFTALAAAMTAAAPAASAAVVAGATVAGTTSSGSVAGTTAAATVVKASLVGGIFGWIGVLLGMKYLEPVFDEREARELRAFRNLALAAVTIGCPLIALASPTSTLLALVAMQSTYGVIAYLYLVRLPRILDRRMAWEQSVNPESAKLNRRRWMWATIGHAFGAALGGTVIMAILLRALA